MAILGSATSRPWSAMVGWNGGSNGGDGDQRSERSETEPSDVADAGFVPFHLLLALENNQ